MASLPEVLQKLVYMKTWFRLEKVTRKSCAGVDQNDATEAVIALEAEQLQQGNERYMKRLQL